ncbi:MAG: hypothetical protein WBP61_14595, partial [Nocardioides sp.]
MTTLISAELDVELAVDGRTTVRGRLHGRSSRLVLEVDDPGAFAGSRDAPAIRDLADGLAAQGVVIRVVSNGRDLVSLGAVSAPWWQRRATGSRRIRLASLRGAWTAARARASGAQPVLPDATLLPP